MFDRLTGLRHHAVIGGHHQDDDVGGLGTARPHGREGLVTRGVEERDHAASCLHMVGANMLGDAAGLTRGHLGAANVIQQRGFTVVNVAHDSHHRRSLQGLRLLLLHLVIGEGLRIIQGGNNRLVTHFFNHDHGRVLIQRLVDGDHLPQLHEVLDNLRGLDRHLVRKLCHRDGLRHMDLDDPHFCRCRLACMVITTVTICASATPARPTAPVAGPASASAGVAAGGNRPLFGWVASPATRQLG